MNAHDLVKGLMQDRGCEALSLDDEGDLDKIVDLMLDLMGDLMVSAQRPLVTFTHPSPPPSSNKIYFVRGGRKILTAAASAWKTRFVTSLGGLSVEELSNIDLSIEDKLHLEIRVYLTPKELRNLGYGVNKSTKYPYAKVDTSNFFKLAEDAVTELLGISCDRQNWKISAYKGEADERGSRIVMHLFPYVPTYDPFDPLQPG